MREKNELQKAFEYGRKAGIQEMKDHIQNQFEIGKPVEANGELYWLKDSRQNLMDIMDDMDSAYEAQNRKKYVIPIQRNVNGQPMELEIIISADTPYEAYQAAVINFSKDGWYVFSDYGEYKEVE